MPPSAPASVHSSAIAPPSVLGTAPPAVPPVSSALPLPLPPVVSEHDSTWCGHSATAILLVVPPCHNPELSAMQIELTVHFSTVYGPGGAPLRHAFMGMDGEDDAVQLVLLTSMHLKLPSPLSPIESAQLLPTEPVSLTVIATGDLNLDVNFNFPMGGADTDGADTDFLMVNTEDTGPADAAFNSPNPMNPASAAKPYAIPIDNGGRPCLAASKVVKEGCQRMLQGAMETELGVDLKAPKLGCWNRYQSYTNHHKNRVHEQQHINVDYVCNDDEEPLLLDNNELLESYSQFLKFCEDYGINPDLIFDLGLTNAHLLFLLLSYLPDILLMPLLLKLHDGAKKYGWYSFLVTTSSHINEDTNLGRVIITGGLGNGALLSTLKWMEDELVAIVKSVAYSRGQLRCAIGGGVGGTRGVGGAEDSAPHRNKHVFGINKMREDMSDASKANVGISIFYNILGGQNFAFCNLVDVFPKIYRLLGWPTGARLPFLCSTDKGIGAFCTAEIITIFGALKVWNTLETGSATSMGLRIEKCPHSDGDYIIFTHDYLRPAPKGPPSDLAVIKHWRTSGGVALPVLDGPQEGLLEGGNQGRQHEPGKQPRADPKIPKQLVIGDTWAHPHVQMVGTPT
ncbi:hypothetical protein B0H17DRAFT_1141724 [Mycena rosella]|uniref:Uncharacterized protein n=1 Tax=Mycena rosella TaxID=1033263 RepID=A0AAD7CYZ7_MYCRO|nr:hypothetical protein B0H17DRAFT_1141724 [Mycena rosella]